MVVLPQGGGDELWVSGDFRTATPPGGVAETRRWLGSGWSGPLGEGGILSLVEPPVGPELLLTVDADFFTPGTELRRWTGASWAPWRAAGDTEGAVDLAGRGRHGDRPLGALCRTAAGWWCAARRGDRTMGRQHGGAGRRRPFRWRHQGRPGVGRRASPRLRPPRSQRRGGGVDWQRLARARHATRGAHPHGGLGRSRRGPAALRGRTRHLPLERPLLGSPRWTRQRPRPRRVLEPTLGRRQLPAVEGVAAGGIASWDGTAWSVPSRRRWRGPRQRHGARHAGLRRDPLSRRDLRQGRLRNAVRPLRLERDELRGRGGSGLRLPPEPLPVRHGRQLGAARDRVRARGDRRRPDAEARGGRRLRGRVHLAEWQQRPGDRLAQPEPGPGRRRAGCPGARHREPVGRAHSPDRRGLRRGRRGEQRAPRRLASVPRLGQLLPLGTAAGDHPDVAARTGDAGGHGDDRRSPRRARDADARRRGAAARFDLGLQLRERAARRGAEPVIPDGPGPQRPGGSARSGSPEGHPGTHRGGPRSRPRRARLQPAAGDRPAVRRGRLGSRPRIARRDARRTGAARAGLHGDRTSRPLRAARPALRGADRAACRRRRPRGQSLRHRCAPLRRRLRCGTGHDAHRQRALRGRRGRGGSPGARARAGRGHRDRE